MIRSRYEFEEDRMRLEVQAAPEDGWVVFLLNRRQWLNLLKAVGVAELAPLKVPPPMPSKKNLGDESAVAQNVMTLRFKEEAGGLRVGFQLKASQVGILFPKEGFSQVGELLFRQAERAGWDPAAGLQRLQAYELAQKTIKKVQSSV